MTISAAGSGPQGAMTRAVVALRQQRQVERESEQDAARQALEATAARAEHATDRAEAIRRSAWLRFGMSLTGSAVELAGSACAGASTAARGSTADNGLPGRLGAAADGLHGAAGAFDMGASSPVAAGDEAFGFGARATALEAEMEQDSLRAERARFVEGEHRARREDIEGALSDVRSAYRDLGSSAEGGA